MNTLAVCSIVKNEFLYLKEWICFGHLQGVSKFYLYHNADVGEDEKTAEAILKLSQQFDIEYTRWPGKSTFEKSVQLAAYDHCLKRATEDWVACIDCDEFLYSPTNVFSTSMLKEYPETAGAILVHWELYGSNGHINYEPGLVIERFTKRAEYLDTHVKTIIRPKAYLSTGKNVHRLILKKGFDTHTTPTIQHLHDSPWLFQNYPGLRNGLCFKLAHFHTKSKEEYRERCARGRADFPIPKEFEPNFLAHDLNQVTDTFLRDLYADRIKSL